MGSQSYPQVSQNIDENGDIVQQQQNYKGDLKTESQSTLDILNIIVTKLDDIAQQLKILND